MAMKTLYESILDDEDDVMDDIGNEAEKNRCLKLIKDMQTRPGHSLYDDDIYYDEKEKGIVMDLTVSDYMKVFWEIANEQPLDIAKIKELSMYGRNINDIKNPIHINHITKLNFNDYTAETYNPKKLTIDNIDEIQLQISGKKKKWDRAFKYLKSDRISIYTTYYDCWGEDYHPINDISGLKTKTLSICYDAFKDKKITSNTQRFILTEDNSKLLDEIFKNNSFDKFVVTNFNTAITKYEVKKSPRSAFGYKLINIR